MKKAASAVLFAAATLSLAGCGETKFMDMLGSGSPSPSSNIAVQTNQNLAMPPDLRLPPPGTGTSEAQSQSAIHDAPAAENGSIDQPVAAAPVRLTSPPPVRPVGDIYERNGISKTHPDGKPKSDGELQAELKSVYLAKKRQTQPGYGTIWNLGNVFKDG